MLQSNNGKSCHDIGCQTELKIIMRKMMEWVKIKNKIDSRKFDRGEDDTHNHRKYETIKAVTKNSYGPLI
jgi:hypothetical protein